MSIIRSWLKRPRGAAVLPRDCLTPLLKQTNTYTKKNNNNNNR